MPSGREGEFTEVEYLLSTRPTEYVTAFPAHRQEGFITSLHVRRERAVALITADLKGVRRTGQGRRGGERSERSLDAAERSRMIESGVTAATRLNALLGGRRSTAHGRRRSHLECDASGVVRGPAYQRRQGCGCGVAEKAIVARIA